MRAPTTTSPSRFISRKSWRACGPLSAGLRATLWYAAERADEPGKFAGGLAAGAAESLSTGVLGLTLAGLAWLLVAVGHRRSSEPV